MASAPPGRPGHRVRALLTGWFSFLHGEATAGDILALQSVGAALQTARIPFDIAWSPVFRPGSLSLDDACPGRYSHLLFICGPVHGEQIAALHERFAPCRRIAVGVSVIRPDDPAVTGFDLILGRDGTDSGPARDLSAAAPVAGPAIPVAGVILSSGQGEYGPRRRHAQVAETLLPWLSRQECAPVPLETRLDTADWRLCSTAAAFTTLIARMDVVITTRLHGLVLGLRARVPVLAIDPIAGGGKVTAQARVWPWPGVLTAGEARVPGRLTELWEWCLSPDGRAAAAACAAPDPAGNQQLTAVVADLLAGIQPGAGQAR